jgi:hypothetical protein
MNEEHFVEFHIDNVSLSLNSSVVIGLVIQTSSERHIEEYVKLLESFHKEGTAICTVNNFSMEKQMTQDIHKYLKKTYPSLFVLNVFRNPVATTCSGCECKLQKNLIIFGECKNCGGVVLVKENLHIATESGQCAIYD